MIKVLAFLVLMVVPAYAEDTSSGLGSQIVEEILHQGRLTAPSATDIVKGFAGQNGDIVFSYRGKVAVYAIASLPTCSANAGMLAYVNNGVATPSYRDTVSTTGSTNQLVWCDGTNWTYR